MAAVAGWATVVGATSAVAWLAIDRAGREVLTASASGLGKARGVATGAPWTPAATTPVTPATTRSTTTSDDQPHTTAPGTTPPRSSSTPSSATSSTHAHTDPTTVPAPPAAVDRTVRVEGGQVAVRCVGRTASLRFAQPADGWSVKVDDTGPEHVKLTFTSAGDRREIEVEAECSNGTPVFQTSDDEHHDSKSDH